MSAESKASSGGVSILGILGVVFVVMKLAGIGDVANWSWWWVTAPFWGGFVLVLAIMAIVFLFAIIASIWVK
jgi:hypothetical protein